MQEGIYWEQKSNRFSSFLNFAASIHLVIGLFPVITFFLTITLSAYGGLKWLGFFFALALSFIAYFIAREQFEIILVRATLKYSIDNNGVNFHYWLGNHRKISFPFESILKISPVTLEGYVNTHRMYFHMIPEIDIKDYRVFTDDEISLIHFDDIEDIELVKQLLHERILENNKSRALTKTAASYNENKFTTSKFSFGMNILGLAYLCLSFYLLLICFDQKVFNQEAKLLQYPNSITSTGLTVYPSGKRSLLMKGLHLTY